MYIHYPPIGQDMMGGVLAPHRLKKLSCRNSLVIHHGDPICLAILDMPDIILVTLIAQVNVGACVTVYYRYKQPWPVSTLSALESFH
jgi:hypothetical protein